MPLDIPNLLGMIALLGPLLIAPAVARAVRGRDYDLFVD